MHYRAILIPAAWAAAPLLWAQSSAIKPAPDWRIGDKREVQVNTEMKITVDSTTVNTRMNSTYVLEVYVARKDRYELLVHNTVVGVPEMLVDAGHEGKGPAKLDHTGTVAITLARAAYKPLSEWGVLYELDRSGKLLGRVEKKDEKAELTAAMQRSVNDALSMMGDAPSIPDARIYFFVDSLYDTFVETQPNRLRSILGMYTTEFPPKGSLRQPAKVQDIQVPLRPDLPDLPAMVEVGLDKNDATELVGRTITTYNPDALHASLVKSFGNLRREGLFVDEERVDRFNKRTTWPASSVEVIRFRSNVVQMDVTVRTELKPIK
ncbi:MAG: hypothetical protein M9900_14975 [Flavobacteriales bacterium]|nr:hypothetical protein [Flavobacteriales bacterium]